MSNTTKACNRFSNENIFKEREKEFLKNEKSFSMKNKNKTSIDFFFKKKKEVKRNYVYSSFLSTSTTSLLKEISDISVRQNLWNKIFSNFNELKQKNEEKKNDTSKSNNIYSIKKYNIGLRNEMYLTGFHYINNSKYLSSYNKNNDSSIKENDFNKIKKKLINKEKNIENIMHNTQSKSFLLSNNSTKNKNTYLLKYFEEQKNIFSKKDKKDMNISFKLDNKLNERNHKNILIKIKTKKINIKKDSLDTFMTKLRAFTILKHETKENDKKKSNIINNYQNKVYYYNDKYKSLNKNIVFLNKKFYGKLNEYMKFINTKIDEEKKRDIHLINKIIFLRDKIKQLNDKLKSKEYEKNTILKWIYFQIQVKEKILTIPSYYKDIIENKTQKNKKIEEKPNKIPNKIIRMSLKPNIKVSKKLNLEGFNQRKSFKVKRFLNQSQKDLTSLKEFVNKSEKCIDATDEETKKVNNYLKFPIFNDINELIDTLEFIQNEITFKIKDYYELRIQIFSYRNILSKYQNDLEMNKINYEKNIEIKDKELEQIKELNDSHNIEKIGVKQYQKKSKSLKILSLDMNKKINIYDYPLIYKIDSIYEKCKFLNLEINIDIKSFGDEKERTPLALDLLYKMKYITQTINIIFNEFKYYREHDKYKSEIIKQTKWELDKQHKAAKSLEQKIKEKERAFKLLNKINEKSNKILFIPKKKVDMNKSIPKKSIIKKLEFEKDTSFLVF